MDGAGGHGGERGRPDLDAVDGGTDTRGAQASQGLPAAYSRAPGFLQPRGRRLQEDRGLLQENYRGPSQGPVIAGVPGIAAATYSWMDRARPKAAVENSSRPPQAADYPSLTYTPRVFVFIETKLFSRLADDYLSEDEHRALQQSLIANPEAGELIRGSGGLRKLRWRGSGRGKRGGGCGSFTTSEPAWARSGC